MRVIPIKDKETGLTTFRTITGPGYQPVRGATGTSKPNTAIGFSRGYTVTKVSGGIMLTFKANTGPGLKKKDVQATLHWTDPRNSMTWTKEEQIAWLNDALFSGMYGEGEMQAQSLPGELYQALNAIAFLYSVGPSAVGLLRNPDLITRIMTGYVDDAVLNAAGVAISQQQANTFKALLITGQGSSDNAALDIVKEWASKPWTYQWDAPGPGRWGY